MRQFEPFHAILGYKKSIKWVVSCVFWAKNDRILLFFDEKTGVKMPFSGVFGVQNDVFWRILSDFEFKQILIISSLRF